MLSRIPSHLIPSVRRTLVNKYGVDVTIQELTYYNWSISKNERYAKQILVDKGKQEITKKMSKIPNYMLDNKIL